MFPTSSYLVFCLSLPSLLLSWHFKGSKQTCARTMRHGSSTFHLLLMIYWEGVTVGLGVRQKLALLTQPASFAVWLPGTKRHLSNDDFAFCTSFTTSNSLPTFRFIWRVFDVSVDTCEILIWNLCFLGGFFTSSCPPSVTLLYCWVSLNVNTVQYHCMCQRQCYSWILID